MLGRGGDELERLIGGGESVLALEGDIERGAHQQHRGQAGHHRAGEPGKAELAAMRDFAIGRLHGQCRAVLEARGLEQGGSDDCAALGSTPHRLLPGADRSPEACHRAAPRAQPLAACLREVNAAKLGRRDPRRIAAKLRVGGTIRGDHAVWREMSHHRRVSTAGRAIEAA